MIKKILYMTLATTMIACSSTKNGTNETPLANGEAGSVVSGSSSAMTAKEKAGANTAFWGKLLGEACREMNMENVCLSPLSAQFAMSMVANGAEGETKQQIYDAMQLGNDANGRGKSLLEDIGTKTVWNENGDIRIANSIWVKEGFDVKQEFIETNKEFFDALVESVEFNAESVKRVNEWCKENTNGRIPSIIERFTENDRMLLINALYFKAAWSKPFQASNTTNRKFTTEKGEEIEVPTMQMRSNEMFYKDEKVAMLTKSLQGGYNMLFVLPAEGVKCDEAAEYVAQDLDTLLYRMELCNVNLSLPKFTTDFGMSLNPILSNLGIKRAFDGRAQFGGISDTPLFVSDVVQKTYINVNEKGTEAAAVTMAIAGLLSARPQKNETITFDRPFIYAIIKNNGNEILFAGKVGNPIRN